MYIKWLRKIDWVWFVRSAMGVMFIAVGIDHADWMPIVFGVVFIATASYAAYFKTGCGYDKNCYLPTNKSPQKNNIE